MDPNLHDQDFRGSETPDEIGCAALRCAGAVSDGTVGPKCRQGARRVEDFRFGATLEDGSEMAEGNLALFRDLLEGALESQASIDQMTDRALVAKWPIARIDPTLRALFRAAGAELLLGKTPPKVVINEFVDIAKAFFPEGRESRFVNAVLDHMAHEARPKAF